MGQRPIDQGQDQPTQRPDFRARAIALIQGERERQQAKWGEQSHEMSRWMLILHEETGELSEAILHEIFGGEKASGVMTEAIQVAAVAQQIVEYLLRTRSQGK